MSGATDQHTDRGRLGGALSLEWRLPLLMTGLLALGMAAMIALAYITLLARAEDIVRNRLDAAVVEVASTASAALAQRGEVLRTVAADSSVRRALVAARFGAADPITGGAATLALRRGLTGRDTILPLELWDAEGRTVASVGGALDPAQRVPARFAPYASGDTSLVRASYMHPVGSEIRFWVTVPVVVGADTLGRVAHLRRVGGPRDASDFLRDMLGEEVMLFTRNDDGSLWLRAPSTIVPPPLSRSGQPGRVTTVRQPEGRFVTSEARIAGTPWILSLESPSAWIATRPRETIRSLALVALMIVLVGAAVAWIASRRITRPLATLTAAAERVATGDYDARLPRAGRDEIGRLAASFDTMAQRVSSSREELVRRAAEAEHANLAKTRFLSTMSHELRTPLNAIAGYVQLLEMGLRGPVTPEQLEDLSRIRRSQQHLLRLISDVLGFARIDAGRVEYSFEHVPLAAALADVEAIVAPQARASGITLSCRAPSEPIVALADPDKLRQVLLNLLANALKYTPRGGTVAVECAAADGRVLVRVSDTGTGIRGDRLAEIFEPFVQGDRALNRPDEGIGLGLAISRELARGMGGSIEVESRVGEGSTFTLSLPRAESVAVPEADPVNASRPSGVTR